MIVINLILWYFLIQESSCTQEFCPISQEGNSCDGSGESIEVKYNSESNIKYAEYSEAIRQAELNYVKCESRGCQCFSDIITRDLKPFSKKGIDKKLFEITRPRGTFYHAVDGVLYREKTCMFPSRCSGIEHFLLKSIVNISNLALVINTRDYPQSSIHFGTALPVFSFSKTVDYYDIMYPAWSFWEGGPSISLYPTGLGRWDKHRKSLNNAYKETLWEQKFNVAFFRGSRTSPERDNLVLLSRAKPDLVNAQYTKNQAWKSDQDTLNAPPATEVSLESHCKYKYLFNYRGVAASFRHKHLFLCGSLVFHVGDEWIEFYYGSMRPWIHYVPVSKDATQKELEELIQFMQDNDELAKKIAEAGRTFIWEKLKMSDVTCYWKNLIIQYMKVMKYKPRKSAELIKIG